MILQSISLGCRLLFFNDGAFVSLKSVHDPINIGTRVLTPISFEGSFGNFLPVLRKA